MIQSERLHASSRLALAAYLHDLGKLAERARIPEAQDVRDAKNNTRADLEKLNYCPQFNGRHTHVHAAYTAIAFDLLEHHLPDLVGADVAPFASWNEPDIDDSLVNAAARHHKPETFLQWVIATADRLASGFEREEFAHYNESHDESEGRSLNHYTTRQWTLLERIRLNGEPGTAHYRYPLSVLSVEALFPVEANKSEMDSREAAQKRYLELWNSLKKGVEDIPKSHRRNLPLWLSHFDSLWLACTHAIPSATAGLGGKVCPDVSLYDHSRTTAALAVSLWRFHSDLNHDKEVIRKELTQQWDKAFQDHSTAETAWNTNKFILIQGDLFGIQDFIFASGGETQKRAAKLLRGRSFYVSLLTELAALKVLDKLDLPATSQVINAAGKFLIVAPNTTETLTHLEQLRQDFDEWFIKNTYGQVGIGIAWLPAKSADFLKGNDTNESPFRDLMRRLFEQLEIIKLRRFDLCGGNPPSTVFTGFLDQFTLGACAVDGRSPASETLEGVAVSQLAADQIRAGTWLANKKRVLITKKDIQHNSLVQSIFGYHVSFTGDEDETGRFGTEAHNGNLRRAFDFSSPKMVSEILWNGYARRDLNAYVPRFGDFNQYDESRYEGLDPPNHPNEFKSLNHLARDDQRFEGTRWQGVEALMTLKGDVDNLGQIFQKGLERPTFAKMAALSRQMNAFFAVYLPWLCEFGEDDGIKRYRNTYTVFAGGDDFFLIGPWDSTRRLATRMRHDFARYVAHNPDIHFSAGLTMSKPGLPIRQVAEMAEEALDRAKSHNPDNISPAPKNAVTAFGESVTWETFDTLTDRAKNLARLNDSYALSTGYLYGLLNYVDRAEKISERPENALWYSHFSYRTRRLVETFFRDIEDRDIREKRRRSLQTELACEIVEQGIVKHLGAYRIALYTHLYNQRD